MKSVTNTLLKYIKNFFEIYKKLHKTPELEFELYNTVTIVKEELSALGISFTEKYGKCSVVAEIGKGEYMAACMPLNITFLGKSSHATLPQCGIDAIAMANKAYIELKKAVEKESHGQKYIWSVGRFHGGTAHNVICDKCEMGITFRFYDMDFAYRMDKKSKEICNDIAKEYGGEVIVDCNVSTGSVINNDKIADEIKRIAENHKIKTNQLQSRMSSEDFGWYLTKALGCLFRYGIYDKEFGSGNVAHTCNFKIYPPAMKTAVKIFTEYVLAVNNK